MIGLSIGGSVPQGIPEPATLLEAGRRAEAAGYDALWSGDHVMMYNPIVECVTLLSALAAVTSRVRLGTAVYLVPLRNPTVTAKLFAGIDYLSGGRLIFGVGVGGEIAKEFEACGVPLRERGARTDEGLEVIRRLWAGPRASFEGRFHRFTDVTIAPGPVQRPHPPIWVGGRSAAALRRTARFGDGWLAYMATPERVRTSMAEIAGHAEKAGRDPASIAGGLLLFTRVGRDRDAARRTVVADLSSRYNQPFETLVDRYCAFGPPAACAETIARYLDAGVRNLVVKLTCSPDEQLDQQQAFAEEVAPLIRGHVCGARTHRSGARTRRT
jgi:probable F420-dependent oxidoreductase